MEDGNHLSTSKGQEIYPLPEGTYLLNHQIAGHVHGKGKTKLGMLKHKNGYILKPLIDDKRGKCELNFYETVYSCDCNDVCTLQLRNFLPVYKGTWETNIDNKRVKYICLEDITDYFNKPSVLDIKIGPQTYDPEAAAEKIMLESPKYPAGKIIGFRILGMRIYQSSTNEYIVYGREFGKQQTPDSVLFALGIFFDSLQSPYREIVIRGFLNKLQAIRQWFERQRTYAFYSSSLLFAYEGDEIRWKQSEDSKDELVVEDIDAPSVTGAAQISSTPRTHLVRSDTYTIISGNTVANCAMHHSEPLAEEIEDDPSLNVSSEKKPVGQFYDLRMIDFCHVFASTETDSNYIFGLEKLISYFERLLNFDN